MMNRLIRTIGACIFTILFLLIGAQFVFAGAGVNGTGTVRIEPCKHEGAPTSGNCINIYPESPGDHEFYYALPKESRDNLTELDGLKDGDKVQYSFGITGGPGIFAITDVIGVNVEVLEKMENMPPAGFEDEVITAFDVYENPFPDTDISTIEGKAAAELYRRAVLGGYPDGEFKGTRQVNRAEAAKFLLQARFGDTEEASGNGGFADVLEGQWYAKYVIKAAQKGIINGYPDGTFRPGNPVNTAEFLKMLSKTFGLAEDLPYSYTDVPPEAWYSKYAGAAQLYGLFPHRENSLLPGQQLMRNEVAVGIYQYLMNRGETVASPPVSFEEDSGDHPFTGDEDAPVIMMWFLDFECPFCEQFFSNTFPLIKENFINTGKVKFVYRDFPLEFHTNAKSAAIAAHCAEEQGGNDIYAGYSEGLFKNRTSLGADLYKELAEELSLDLPQFGQCVESEKYLDKVESDIAKATALGIQSSPSFIINGRMVVGAQPYEVFEEAILEALGE